MRLKGIYIIILLIITSLQGFAQKWPFELWHEGKIVLLEGDTLKGLVKYDLMRDMVEFTGNDKKLDAFTARKVLFFEIFDQTVNQYRKFYTLPYNTSGAYKAPLFFELLAEGKLTLMCREFVEYKTVTNSFYAGAYSREVLSHKYFFLTDNGEIEEFIGNKNDLLNKMGKKSDQVQKYMKSNRLKFDNKNDLALIVSYYNSLFQI